MLSATTNTAALTAQRFLDQSSSMASSSIAKMSSGSRIVKASDDASSLAIGNKLRADISALQQATRNASQGASLLQVTNGAIDRIGDILTRLKTLSTQVVNGSLSTPERQFAQQEFTELVTQIDQISSQTRWNSVSMLNGGDKTLASTNTLGSDVSAGVSGARGSATPGGYFNPTTASNVFNTFTGTVDGQAKSVTVVQNGSANQFKINIEIGNQTFEGYASYSQASGGSITMTSTTNSHNTFRIVNNAAALGTSAATLESDLESALSLDTTTSPPASFQSKALTNANAAALLEAGATTLGSVITATGAAVDGIYNLTSRHDTATGTTTFRVQHEDGSVYQATLPNASTATGQQTIVFSNGTELKLAEAQAQATATTNLEGVRFEVTRGSATTMDFQVGVKATDTITISFVAMTSQSLGLDVLNIETQAGGTTASAAVSDAINKVNIAQAQLGSIQSRMEYVQSNLSTIIENLSAAKGIFLDVDMAREMTEFTKQQTLMQAGVAMLAQANQMPQSLLRLIQGG